MWPAAWLFAFVCPAPATYFSFAWCKSLVVALLCPLLLQDVTTHRRFRLDQPSEWSKHREKAYWCPWIQCCDLCDSFHLSPVISVSRPFPIIIQYSFTSASYLTCSLNLTLFSLVFKLVCGCLLDLYWSCLLLQTAYLLLTYILKICLCLHTDSCLWVSVLSSCTDNPHLKSQKHKGDNYPDFCQSFRSVSEPKVWWQQSKQGSAIIRLLMSRCSWEGGGFPLLFNL